MRLDPALTDAHLDLGVVLAELGREQAAIHEFEEVLRQHPDDARARRNLELLRSATRQPGGRQRTLDGTHR